MLVLLLLACGLRQYRQRYEPMQSIIAAIRDNPELKSQVETAAGVTMPAVPSSRPSLLFSVMCGVATFVLSFFMILMAINVALNKTSPDDSNTMAMLTFAGWFQLVLLVEVGLVYGMGMCFKKCSACCSTTDGTPATDAPTLRSRVLAYVRRQSPPPGYDALNSEETELSQVSTVTASSPPYCVVLAHGAEAPIVSARSLSNVTII